MDIEHENYKRNNLTNNFDFMLNSANDELGIARHHADMTLVTSIVC